MKKRILAGIIAMVMVLSLVTVTSFAANKVKLNGKELVMDVEPQNIEGRLLVPLRAIFESLGATVSWDDATKTVTGTKGAIVVKLTIGNKKVSVSGMEKEIDVPAIIISGRTMVPLRFVSEALGAKVSWDDANKTAIIDEGASQPTSTPAPTQTPAPTVKPTTAPPTGGGTGGSLPLSILKSGIVFSPNPDDKWSVKNVIDGSDRTSWQSQYKKLDQAWIIFDLGSEKQITKIQLVMSSILKSAYISNISVLGSNDPTFKTNKVLGTVGENSKTTIDFTVTDAAKYRYVKLDMTKLTANSAFVSEFKVFGN